MLVSTTQGLEPTSPLPQGQQASAHTSRARRLLTSSMVRIGLINTKKAITAPSPGATYFRMISPGVICVHGLHSLSLHHRKTFRPGVVR